MDEDMGEGEDVGDLIEASLYDELMGKSVEDILRDGQKALFARLVAKQRSGRASHQEAAILRNILKDNGVVLGIPPAALLANRETPLDLPEFGDPEYQQ